jgi:prevent-host-death family protein
MIAHTISYFRNHALQLLSGVATTGEEILVTRRGEPLAHIAPANARRRTELGKLAGSMEIKGDIVGPLGDDDWSASH